MTSSPLFISVAESMVTFWPICHDGCRNACATVTSASCSGEYWRKGPPEAVRIIRAAAWSSPLRHCHTALCSLSTGRIRAPLFLASSLIISPAETSDSLLASAISFPARNAARVGLNPTFPDVAMTTMSTSGLAAISSRGSRSFFMSTIRFNRSIALFSDGKPMNSGLNSFICSASSSRFFPAASPTTRKRCGIARMTSSVCLPMEPVEPRTATRFTVLTIALLSYNKRVQECNPEPAKILFKGNPYSADNSNTTESVIRFSDYEFSSFSSSSSSSSMLGKSKTRGSLPL